MPSRCEKRNKPCRAEILRVAVEDLVRRGVITPGRNEQGEITYTFPDVETGRRLLRESEDPQ